MEHQICTNFIKLTEIHYSDNKYGNCLINIDSIKCLKSEGKNTLITLEHGPNGPNIFVKESFDTILQRLHEHSRFINIF